VWSWWVRCGPGGSGVVLGALGVFLGGHVCSCSATVVSSRQLSERVMADRTARCRVLGYYIKSLLWALLFIFLSIFAIASLRTFSLDVNAGLQLADWEKTNLIGFNINQRQRDELLENFKGDFGFIIVIKISSRVIR